MNRRGLGRLTALLLMGAAGVSGGCRRGGERPPPDGDASPSAAVDAGPREPRPTAATRTADLPQLPEDPQAGRRSEAQWRGHMEHEEYERQLAYDRRRLTEHRALVERLRNARARLDAGNSAAAVARLAAATSAAIADARRRVQRLDHWGVNSRLLGDYDDLLKVLDGPYAAARISALRGDPGALERQRGRWDEHMQAIDEWLAAAADADDVP